MAIEADSEEEAVQRSEQIGLYFNGVEQGIDCDCCGDRWYKDPDYTLETIEEVKIFSFKSVTEKDTQVCIHTVDKGIMVIEI